MTQMTSEPKFPKFIGHLSSKGLDMKKFTNVLKDEGYEKYQYHTVRRKLNGESTLHFDDIVIFSKVMDVDESIFFNN